MRLTYKMKTPAERHWLVNVWRGAISEKIREELVELLSTTPAALSQCAYRSELPPTALIGKQRAC